MISRAPKRDTLVLYQNPARWTRRHLRIANVEHEVDVPIERIIDLRYIPSDDDEGTQPALSLGCTFKRTDDDLTRESDFQNMANDFRNPPWLVPDGDRPDKSQKMDPTVPFFTFFTAIQYSESEDDEGPMDGSDIFDSIEVLDAILQRVFPDQRMYGPPPLVLRETPHTWREVRPWDRIPLAATELWVKDAVGEKVDASIGRLGWTTTDEGLQVLAGIPLAVIMAKPERGDLGMAKREIPQLLLQLNMVFNFDDSRDEYDAFVISFHRPFQYTFVRAIASAEYIRSVRANERVDGGLKVLRSRTFDIAGVAYWDARREFLRGMVGLARYLVSRAEYRFPQHGI
ncbi:hypothetical protein BJY01DRAFT_242905 [Aspergillus pseudoustus]|uniref:Uncharacterized protein n=1 Tax=Aspergillus pseudoustus TaxID=1810923 RepID=A0ABR4KUL1_9EURO